MYEYRVKDILSVYDGDTVTLRVDLGFGIDYTIKVRLLGIDTPEIRGEDRPEGIVARDWLRNRLTTAVDAGYTITVKTVKDRTGKYGRYLGDLCIGDDRMSVNEELVSLGLAVEYMK